MKTPDEIKKGLECCNKLECDACPYHGENDCSYLPCEDGLAYIRQLEAERDAMKALFVDPNDLCAICKHQDYDAVVCQLVDYCCELCSPNCACHGCVEASHYEWRGVQKEE